MSAPQRAGLWYFIFVFVAGFVLGTLRVLVLLPTFGEGIALTLEIPVMLAICWVVAGEVIARHGVPAQLGPRLEMGALAFGLLMLAETGLSMFGFGNSLSDHLTHYMTRAGAAGLGGQVVFALIPAIRLRVYR